MANITIKMKDGTVREFLSQEWSGGDFFTKRLRYEPGFVVIEDENYNETAIPAEDIAEVNVYPIRRF